MTEVAERDGGVTLEDLKKRMAGFAKERDWDQYHSPSNLLLALVKIYQNPKHLNIRFGYLQCPCNNLFLYHTLMIFMLYPLLCFVLVFKIQIHV